MSQMDELRDQIEKIDEQMIDLFEERMRVSAKVAAFKKEHGIPVLDKDREKVLIAKNAGKIKNKDLEVYYKEFFEGVLNVSKSYQHKLMEGVKVAYSGIEGSFAAIAAEEIFPEVERLSCRTFREAYEQAEKGNCDACVLPVENSYAGEVGQVSDLMFSGTLKISGVYELRVSQCLLGIRGSAALCGRARGCGKAIKRFMESA